MNNTRTTFVQISPSKKSTFRSKTKLKDTATTSQFQIKNKTVSSFKMYLKQFPLGLAEEVVKILNNFEPVHYKFQQNLESLKLYKAGLASQFQNNWAQFMDVLRVIISKLQKRTEKIVEEKQLKIIQLMNLNSQGERQKEKIKQKLANIENLRQLQNAQLTIANSEVDLVNRQMNDIYKILQTDMGRIMKYLTNVEQTKKRQEKQGAMQFYSSLDNFTTLINKIEDEKKQAGQTLGTMRELIKAMARGAKSTTGTQVDQTQLQTQAANIFTSDENASIPYEALEGTALHTTGQGNYEHTLDKLKLKQKDHGHESYNPKKNIDKPWALTPTLLIFLQNMSKENEAGRVIPWQYMKTLINQIYDERIRSENQMTSAMVGNSMLFDQFVVFYFLKKYKIRRLAEVKLLEFIISLKYYSRFWIKAETFCLLMDVMKHQPLFDPNDSNNYRLDYYAQNFFFQVYKRMSKFDLIHEEDGTVYVPTKKVKKLMKLMLFFTDDIHRSRLSVKFEKDIRIYQKVQHADFDYAMQLFIDEYFASRKRNSNSLGRAFNKLKDQVQGFISIDELLGVFNELSKIYNSGEQFPQKYPVQSPLQISKLYLYAITSGKNDYQMSCNEFLQACQRYGFDSPFPFIHTCQKLRREDSQILLQRQESLQLSKVISKEQKTKVPLFTTVQKRESDIMNLNQERVDSTSKIFSQHFSLLKQMKDYVDIFSKTLMNEKDPEVMWKSFNQIKAVLDKGCQFLKYPLISVKDMGK